MAARRRQGERDRTGRLCPLVRGYVLRALIDLDGHREFLSPTGFRNDRLAEALELHPWMECFDYQIVRAELRRQHWLAARHARRHRVAEPLAGNLARLGDLVGLSETDRRILAFAVLLKTEPLLHLSCDWAGQHDTAGAIRAVASMLSLPEAAIRSALAPAGRLARTGLLTVDFNPSRCLSYKFDLLSSAFPDHVRGFECSPLDLVRDIVKTADPPSLARTDYAHLSGWLDVLLPHLRGALDSGRRGVNVFLHGSPGTGKTQLGRVLAAELGCELFEIAFEDTDGDPIDAAGRLRAYRAAQYIVAQRRAMLLFDEVEDVFSDGGGPFGRPSTAQSHKAWINRALESGAVPTIWLSNSIDDVDPAFIRRFDMVVQMPVPPYPQRERLIASACGDLLGPPEVARLAEMEQLAPAVITKAASVARGIRDEVGVQGAAKAVQLLISSTLQAQGHRFLRPGGVDLGPYDLSFLQTDADLCRVADGLVQARTGRICLYGPPGTGKSAFGRWLGRRLGLPVMVRRASELLSKWLGENEQNIAAAFEQAEAQGALLLMDEVDSFLRDRRLAGHSWEASIVNEMLTRMEAFSGVFVASTNLMDDLDQAALRRFDLKVRFGYLSRSQAEALLRRHCEVLDLDAPTALDLTRLEGIQCLTPGDFAAVARQAVFTPPQSAAGFVAALEAECRLKQAVSRPIGFTA